MPPKRKRKPRGGSVPARPVTPPHLRPRTQVVPELEPGAVLTEPAENLFDDPVAVEALPRQARDGYGRPYVAPPEGGYPKPYTRCTTFVDALEDKYNLGLWQQRMVAEGLSMRPDLVLSVAANRGDKDEINRLCEEAKEAAAASSKATTGTALHKITESHDLGKPVEHIPPQFQADVAAYVKATREAGLEHVSIEQFCVLDMWGGIGGTPDRVERLFDKYYIGDLKTGGSLDFGVLKFAMQFAVYAHSRPYDWRNTPDKKTVVSPDEAAKLRGEWPGPIDQERALLIHLPKGKGVCNLYWVNISDGWEAVKIAAAVRAWRSRKNLLTPFNLEVEKALYLIDTSETSNQVRSVYLDFVNNGNNGDLIIKACKQRVFAIEQAKKVGK